MRAAPARRAAATLAAAALLIMSLAGCGEGIARGSGPPQVVAAESTWGSIAQQLAGPGAHTTSIIANPALDPHSYEPTAADARALATAQLVVVNGIGYDPWARHLLSANPQRGRIVLDVGSLLHIPGDGNPHRWYDPGDVEAVARAIARDLSTLDPPRRGLYAQRLDRFEHVTLGPYHRLVADLRHRYAGEPVGASESIFALLAPALRLRLVTPPGFLKAVSEGTEPSARDTATARAQITGALIRVWVFNAQNATPEVNRLTAAARERGIAVVPITESPTPAGSSFEAWQVAQLRRLARALHEATGR